MRPQAKKRFGQNFLQDQNIIFAIVKAIKPLFTDHLVEIGPGLGALSQQLLPLCHKLTAIEIDQDVIGPLKKNCDNQGTLDLIIQDVLFVDFAALKPQPLRIVGNLPYNIATPILFKLCWPNIDTQPNVKDMHFMVQKEVAERIVADPGNKAYGRLSVMLQYQCHCTLLITVPPSAFKPQPQVDSAVIRLTPKKKIHVANDETLFAEMVKHAFAMRRKTLANNLKKYLSSSEISALGIDPKARAEQLRVADFVSIANAIEK